jgi:hypothetical protein
MKWKCNNCENLNDEKVYACEVCDNQSPILVSLIHKEYEDSSEPIFLISWKIENATSIIIDNGIGEVKEEGESLLKITKNTTLKLSAKNRIAEREFQLKLDLPKPTIESFTVDNEVIEFGKPSLFSWKVRNAEKVLLSEFGEVTDFTEKEINLKSSKKVTLSTENAGGKVSKQITLTLPKPEILLFETEKDLITEGEEILLRWEVKNAETVLINKFGKIEEIKSGEIRISPKEKSRYTIVAKNSSGETTKDLLIEVEPKPIIENLRASKDLILRNSKVKLTWALKNSSRVNLFFGTEVIDVSKLTEYSLDLDGTTDFTLVASSLKGLCEVSKIITVSVIDSVEVISFNADRLFTVQSKPIELFWDVKNAKSIKITPDLGDVTTKKKAFVSPDKKTTYTIEASNELTKSVKVVTIDVLPLPTISTLKLADVPKFDLAAPKVSLYDNPLFAKEIENKPKFWQRIFRNKRIENESIKIAFLEFRYQSGQTRIEYKTPFYFFKNILNQQNLNFQTLFSTIRKKLDSHL